MSHQNRQQMSSTFDSKQLKNEKIAVFRAHKHLVHKTCGQDVENHVNKEPAKPLYNNLHPLPNF